LPDTSKRIVFVRHGETEWNRELRYQGRTDVPLSPEGEQQAELVGRRLAAWRPDAAFSSPMKRATRTAEIILEKTGVPGNLTVLEEIAEMSFGEWETLRVAEVKEKFPERYANWRKDPSTGYPPGGEPFERVCKRVDTAIREILDLPGKRFLVVCHGGTIRAAMVGMLGFSFSSVWNIRLDNCGIVVIDTWSSHSTMACWNDSSHLRLSPGIAPEMLPLP